MATAARDNSRTGSVAQAIRASERRTSGRRSQAESLGWPATVIAPVWPTPAAVLRPATAAEHSMVWQSGPALRIGWLRRARRTASGWFGAGAARAPASAAASDTVSAQTLQTGASTAPAASPPPPADLRTVSAASSSAELSTAPAPDPPTAAEHAAVAAYACRHRRREPNPDAVVRVGQLHRAIHLPGRAWRTGPARPGASGGLALRCGRQPRVPQLCAAGTDVLNQVHRIGSGPRVGGPGGIRRSPWFQ